MKILRKIMSGSFAAALIITAAVLAGPAAAAGSGDAGLPAVDQAPLTVEEKQVLRRRVRMTIEAGVPAEDVEIIVTRSLAQGIDTAVIGRFLETPAGVARQGLPVRPVVDRIEQGLSKGVPPERIDAAGKRLADGLAEAKPVVDGLLRSGMPAGSVGYTDAALESVARAYEQSLSPGSMRALGEQVRLKGRSLEQFERAVRTLSFLAGSGMPADAAERTVRACIEGDLSERGFAQLERRVGDMLRKGRSMDDIVRTMDREVREEHVRSKGRDKGTQERGAGGSRDAGSRPGRGR